MKGPKREIRAEQMVKWQEEWDQAEGGRFACEILPNVAERQSLKHLQLNHETDQIITGHGAFKKYLFKHNKCDSEECDHCPGHIDSPDMS